MSHNGPACDPSQRHAAARVLEELPALAASIASLSSGNRTTAIASLVLTAERAGISRSTAETIIRAALDEAAQ